MVNGRFVMLGTDNTEKSGLISAFYQQLSDHTVFTAQSQLSSPIQYTPFAGNDEISSMHTFAMCFENNAMVRIELTDFSEQFLNTFRNDLPEYSAYVNSIHSADVVYILIDGSHFLTDSIDMCVKNLKRKCARFITPLLASSVDLDEENSDDKLNQTIIFLVTKSQRLLPRYTPSDLNQILKQAFNNLFDIENQGHAEPYTVCVLAQEARLSHVICLQTMSYAIAIKNGML